MEIAEIGRIVKPARELNVDAADIGETTVATNTLWDSVKHVDIIFGQHDAFRIGLEHFEAQGMLSCPEIVEILARKLATPGAKIGTNPQHS
jgi:hypothetical protein